MARTSGAARAGRRIVIALVVVVLVLVAADRVGVYVAQRIAGDTIQTSQKLRDRPAVDIAGFPFVTQLAGGTFGQVTVTASRVPVGGHGGTLTLDRIRVVLDHVTVARDFSRVHADTASAVASVGYGELSRVLGVDVSYAGDGRVRAQKKISILGQSVTPSITAAPVLVNGALGFGATQLNGLDALAGQAAQLLKSVFDLTVPLDGIPFEIRIQSLAVDASGLVIRLSGADLTYTDSTKH